MSYRKPTLMIFTLAALWASLVIALAAGGQVVGTITDPKGALVSGAAITLLDPLSNQTFTATTDEQGRFKVEGLPAGAYTLTISAKGFSDVRRESVNVEEGATATVDAQLEMAPVEAEVKVGSSAASANLDTVYQQLRQNAENRDAFTGSVASVSNLVLKRDAATFTLANGEIYFIAPVDGRTTGAVFIGEGELSLTPPTQAEKNSLALFTDKQQTLTEPFTQLVLRFSDKTFEEIESSPNVRLSKGGAQAERARGIYRDKQSLWRKQLRYNMDLRALADMYAPQRPGFFIAFIAGRRFSKLIYQLDPLGIPEVTPEEVMLMSYGESDGGIWTAFHLADSDRTASAANADNHWVFDILRHEIDGNIRGTHIAASDRITFSAPVSGARVLPFNLYPSLRVTSVQDEQRRNLDFVQESKDEDADFAVILPKPLEAGKTYKIIVQYQGRDALDSIGSGNFFLIPRSTWYPNNGGTQFGDRALFEMTFRYPKLYTFVGTGAPVMADAQDGDTKVSKWSSGSTELEVAGFNYGLFKKKEVMDTETGYNVEYYANEELPGLGPGRFSTTKMGDVAIADAQNATRIYNAFYGKLPYSRIAITQQPAAFFGQAWPTLIYMPFTALLDRTDRRMLIGGQANLNSFWQYVGPHEVAHQWWGHVIGWKSYRDQWMSEGFAEFSASLYVQYVRKDQDKFIAFWEEHRKQITEATPATRGRKPYTVGPVTQGFRLSNGKTGAIYRFLVYPKGAYILHMLRMMMFDPAQGGDARFQAMMVDFVKTHFNQDVTTEDFKRIADKHMPPQMNLGGNGRMDWYFDQWVYGTEIPSYRFDYQLGSAGGQTVLNGRITQSGVSDDFRMKVPIYVDFGKGWERLGSTAIMGDKPVDLPNIPLPQKPKRVAICALNDVLALSIENNKR